MKKFILFAFLLGSLSQVNAQMMMAPSKDVTKAIKKNPQLLNAINNNPQLLNSLNINDKLLDAVVDDAQILNLVSNNPAILNTINASPDFLKLLTKKPEVLMAVSLNPQIANILNDNPTLIPSIVKKPELINTVALSSSNNNSGNKNNQSYNNNSNNQNYNNSNQTSINNSNSQQSTVNLLENVSKEEKKSTGSKLLNGALGIATGGIIGSGGSLFTGKLLPGVDLQKNIDKSKNQNIFLSKRYDDYTAAHKVVAIIPFSVDIEGENKKQITSKKERVRNEKEIEEKIQESLYKFLLKHQNKYSIEFQDISTTNLKLKNSGIMSTLYTTSKEDIAKALGVDAVIAGNYDQKMNNKESKSGIIKITLFDGVSGDWVWKMDENAGSKYSLIDETDKLMNNLMEKVANYFPYRSK